MSGAPGEWPWLGHWPAFRADTTGFLLGLARTQGDVARFRLGRRDAVLFSHPQQVRAVLIDHAADFTKGQLIRRARRLLGDGLLTSEGDLHRCQRRRIQPAFTTSKVQQYAALVPDLASRLTSQWENGSGIRVDTAMDGLTMSIVAKALLGADIERQVPQVGAALRRLARWAPLLALPGGRVLERSRLPVIGQLRAAIELVEGVIAQRIAEGGASAPLLGALMNAGTQDGPMPAQLIRDEVMTNFLAGQDTTATALTWIWLLLGAHPEVEARMLAELDQPDRPERTYTGWVIKEALRLYPPVGRIGRQPTRDLELEGHQLRRGSAVFVSAYVTQRDARWFPDPEMFRPDRWADSAHDRPPFAWFPFGAGPRSCIGEHFSRAVMLEVVETISRHWRLRPTRAGVPAVRSLLTLKPRGPVWMVAERRWPGRESDLSGSVDSVMMHRPVRRA
ncbi:MAG: cytochrome P450 [Gemmatimonadales bacterium]